MAQEEKVIYVPELIRRGDRIILPDPEKMSLKEVHEFIGKKLVYDEKLVEFHEDFSCFIWDGARALELALVECFGFALQEEKVIDFLGTKVRISPKKFRVETGIGVAEDIPWGQFSFPGFEGYVETNWTRNNDGQFIFQAHAKVKHKDEHKVHRLFQKVREILQTESIYRGKAIQVRFTSDDGDMIAMPQPKFFELSETPPIFNRQIEQAIDDFILARIRYPEMTLRTTGKLKYGMLLAGIYGTGKTLCANMVAKTCMEHGWTFIYLKETSELPIVLPFAQGFQPAVVFAEDIDRAAGENRTDEVNRLLNTLDGLGSKNDNIITIVTSNNPEQINDAMKRPGRIDLILKIETPDAEATERLIRYYGKSDLPEDANLMMAGDILKGSIPAVIREAVERAQLIAINRTNGQSARIEPVDVEVAGGLLIKERQLFHREKETRTIAEIAADRLGQSLGKIVVRELNKAQAQQREEVTR